MRRWIVVVAIVASLAVVGFTTAFVASHHDEPHAATPTEYTAWEKAVCDAAREGRPDPGPIYMGDGKWESMACDVNGA
jgi:hypothetical protein